jgi:hypothetical protein
MVETLKSLAKSLPYPVFLRLFYLWDRMRWRRWAEAARKRAGIPSLDQVDLLQMKSSDTLFVLGSGPSINRISAERWRLIAAHDTVGFNWWLYHAFVPKFYFLEVIEKEVFPEAFECYLTLASRRAADYASTIKIAMEFHRLGAQTLDHLPPAFRKNLFAAHKVEAPARNEAELTRALRYLQTGGAFQVTGRFSSLLKYAASLTTMLAFALKLGYKRVVLCGIDLKRPDYFFQDRRFYPESWEPPEAERFETHFTEVPLTWKLPVTRAVAVMKQQLLDPAGVELYIESQDSALWPIVPVLPVTASEVSWISKTLTESSHTSNSGLARL